MNKALYKSILNAFSTSSGITVNKATGLKVAYESLDPNTFELSGRFAKQIDENGVETPNPDLLAFEDMMRNYKETLRNLEVRTEGFSGETRTVNLESMMTKSQIAAGFLAYLGGATHGFESQVKLQQPRMPDGTENYQLVSVPSYSAEHYDISTLNYKKESFDGSSRENTIYLSMVIAMVTARQEEFAEAFCPTVLCKPDEIGTYVSVRYSSFVNDYLLERNQTQLIESKMNRRPIIKNIYNPVVMGQDKTLIVPAWSSSGNGQEDEDSKKWLVPGVKFINSKRGFDVESGFYKKGVGVNVLQLSQSQVDISRDGLMDYTDSVLPGVSVDSLLVELQPKGATSSAKIVFDIRGLHGSAFSNNQQNHMKDITLSMREQRVAIKLGSVLDYQKANVDFSGCSEVNNKKGYSLVYEFTLVGDGNFQTGSFNVSDTQFHLVDVLDTAGVSLGLDNTGVADLVDAFSKSAVKSSVLGYGLLAYRANTNLRTTGQRIQSDGYQFLYGVNFRSPYTVQGPVSAYTGTEGDFEVLNDAMSAVVMASSFAGIRRVLSFADELKQSQSTGRKGLSTQTLDYNSALLEDYYFEKDIDLSKCVDSLTSNSRLDDIRSAIHNQIREDALKMLRESNYKNAHDKIYGDQKKKITVLIGTHYHLAQYFCQQTADGTFVDTFDLSEDLNCKVVHTMCDDLIQPDGRFTVIMTFSVTDQIGSIDSIQKLHPGFRLFSNVVTVTVDAVTKQGAVKQMTQLIPKYEHHMTMRVMTKWNVTGINDVIEKVSLNFHPVQP